MGFRRYGGDFQFKGGASAKVALIGLVLLIIFTLLAIILNIPQLIVVGLALLFLFTVIASVPQSESTSGLLQRRQIRHLKKAQDALSKGQMVNAKEHLRRARVHGDLPEGFENLVREIDAFGKV